MWLSPKTIEWNLSKIYRKLGVRSRTELAAKLARRLIPYVTLVRRLFTLDQGVIDRADTEILGV
jgi:hypothetical protein